MTASALDLFLPAVATWFRQDLGEPTPPQRLGWPEIAAGKHTLILAPTGSGKTLAAFLACLDQLWRDPGPDKQVQVLYISPLKALNVDIQRNLQRPLQGVQRVAHDQGCPLPELRVAVRTGDTPATERQKLVRQPPHILITTPESLHLLLTSRARDTLRAVRYCIVDEIHALCPNKRGVFLALLLERLAELNRPSEFVRIGLSATQRPLEEVARYLGGRDDAGRERPVTRVDAGQRKQLDVRVVHPVGQFGPQPEKSVWPAIYRLLHDEVRRHRSTIIFANNRRTVERVTNHLNELADQVRGGGQATDDPVAPPSPRGTATTNTALPPMAQSHHGSLSLENRQGIEAKLKAGEIPAVVATASLELGIDMGEVDLVCQIESPGNIARTLQRVGRAGHLVGQTSQGRLIPKMLPDLLEQAALVREMLAGRVERIQVPTNPLDVLAQQVVAMAALEPIAVDDLLRIVRRAYPYRNLAPEALESVLELVSGRFPSEAARDLQARVSWDRIHNRLHPLPGTQRVSLVNGGTIPDTGQFAAFIDGTNVRIGELDEEFVYERRIGDVFLLGTTAWRITTIESDRVYVSRAEGAAAIMPFWRGEKVARSPDLGEAMGRFNQELMERLRADPAATETWLMDECRLDRPAAQDLVRYVRRQIERAGMIPTHEHLLVESFRDPLGDWYLAFMAPLGTRFHFALRLAVEAYWLRRYGYRPACLHHDDGLLLKVVDMDEPPLDVLSQLPTETLDDDILNELANSALFAIRFRHNAARAMLLSKGQPDRRAPLWLQRLKAKNLLQICRSYPRFPIVLETYRECLHDHLDVPRLRQFLAGLRTGAARQTQLRSEVPSPFGGSLLFGFQAAFLYEYDKVAAENAARPVDRDLLAAVTDPETQAHLLDPRAISQVDRRLRGDGVVPRSAVELAEWLRRRGDARRSEWPGELDAWLATLQADGRVVEITLPGVPEPQRWILAEEQPLYAAAFHGAGEAGAAEPAAERILRRFLTTHALVGLADVLERYPFEPRWVERQLQAWTRTGEAVALQPQADAPTVQWAAPVNFEEVQRTALALRRREAITLPFHRFVDFVLRWQYGHPNTQRHGLAGLFEVLDRLRGWLLPVELWETAVLGTRLKDYHSRWLDELTQSGTWTWVGSGSADELDHVAFLRRDELASFRAPTIDPPDDVGGVYEALRIHGASFLVDLARLTGESPSAVRAALWRLVRLGLATNDRFDTVRRGEETERLEDSQGGPRRLSLRKLKRQRVAQPVGRWSLLTWGMPDTEALALHQAAMLLERYGIVAREAAQTDPWLLPWRVLYDMLSRLEMMGEVRRGYFVEGLSGAQFALPEAARQWADHGVATPAEEPALLLHSLDPANVLPFQSTTRAGASDGNDRSTIRRRSGTWLVLRGGKMVLTVESMGKRLVPADGATARDLEAAMKVLKDLLRFGGPQPRARICVEEWAGTPILNSPGRELLESAGFVRDYQSLTLHHVWS